MLRLYSGNIFPSRINIDADSRFIFRMFRGYVPGFRYIYIKSHRGPDIYIPAPITIYKGVPEYRYVINSVSFISIFREAFRDIIFNYIKWLCKFRSLRSGYVPEYSGI